LLGPWGKKQRKENNLSNSSCWVKPIGSWLIRAKYTLNSFFWTLRGTLDEGSRSRNQWIQAILLVESFKLVPRQEKSIGSDQKTVLKGELQGTSPTQGFQFASNQSNSVPRKLDPGPSSKVGLILELEDQNLKRLSNCVGYGNTHNRYFLNAIFCQETYMYMLGIGISW
jgi:hypothetical protein